MQARRAFEQDQRTATILAITFVGTYLDHIVSCERNAGREWGDVTVPLIRLAGSLDALSEGVVEPILAPSTSARRHVLNEAEDDARGRKPPLSRNVLFARSTAAAVMQIAMDAGLDRKAAATFVADRIAGSALMEGVRAVPWRAVARWRDDVLALGETRGSTDVLLVKVPTDREAACAYNEQVKFSRQQSRAENLSPAQVLRFAANLLGIAHTLGGGPADSDLARTKAERDPA